MLSSPFTRTSEKLIRRWPHHQSTPHRSPQGRLCGLRHLFSLHRALPGKHRHHLLTSRCRVSASRPIDFVSNPIHANSRPARLLPHLSHGHPLDPSLLSGVADLLHGMVFVVARVLKNRSSNRTKATMPKCAVDVAVLATGIRLFAKRQVVC